MVGLFIRKYNREDLFFYCNYDQLRRYQFLKIIGYYKGDLANKV